MRAKADFSCNDKWTKFPLKLFESQVNNFRNRVTKQIKATGTVRAEAEPEQKAKSDKNLFKLTDTESYILEALGKDTLKGPVLLKKAGYDNSSHYRNILSNLVKRKILERNGKGYYAV
ncbi:MAG: hypothetical protein JW804_09110 [Sedimentisphaerales bacterium]|nr:hypothetical protein [Sedimentisphaerales bacterium]